MTRKTFWTPDNIKRLNALIVRGRLVVTVADAGKLLGTSAGTVHVELTRRGVTCLGRRNAVWTKQKLSQLKLLVDERGKLKISAPKAALIIGCDRHSIVDGLLALQGRKSSGDNVDNATLDTMVRERALTVPIADAAHTLGLSVKVMKRVLRDRQLLSQGRFAWTEDKLDALRPLTDRHGRLRLSLADATTRIGCSPRALQMRLALPPSRRWVATPPRDVSPPPVRRERRSGKLAPFCKDGALTLSVATAAARFRVGRQTIRNWMKELGVRPEFPATMSLLRILRHWLPKLTPIDVARAAKEEPRLAGMRREHLEFRMKALARAFRVDEPVALSMALSAPTLFVKRMSFVRATIKAATALLGPPAAFFKAAPHAAVLDADALTARVEGIATFLEVNPARLLTIVRRHPGIILHDNAAHAAHAREFARLLALPRTAARTAMRRQPGLLLVSPDIVANHATRAAELLHVPRKSIARAFIFNPSLLQVKPETLLTNVTEGAHLLGCDPQALARAYLHRPPLLTMKPDTIATRVEDLCGIFEHTHARMVTFILKYPYLLTFTAENTQQKAWLLVKLAQAVGRSDDLAALLAHVPIAFTYSKERIAARVEMARQGIGPKSVGGLLSMPDHEAAKLVAAHGNQSPLSA